MSSLNRKRAPDSPSLHPSRYDRIASLLISTLIFVGTSVAVLVVLWLGTQRDIPRESIIVGGGFAGGSPSDAQADEFDTPSVAELSNVSLLEPVFGLSTLLSSEAVAAAAQIETDGLTSGLDGKKDGRPVGKELKDAVPRWERWEIRYEAPTLKSYARQLDFFGIELGAVGGAPQVDYAYQLSATTPKNRQGLGDEEKRLYLTWRGGRLEGLDRKLLENAGIEVDRRIVMQFYPQKVEDTLARLEKEHTKDGRVDKLRKTIFGVRSTNGGYEFFIIEQRQ